MCAALSAFLSLCKKPSDTELPPKSARALLLSSFYHRTPPLLRLSARYTCDRSAFQTHLIAFQTPVTPTPSFPRLPLRRVRTQLSAAQILHVPWPSLPPFPEPTPPQPRVVERMIFYACHSSPHTDTAYERHAEPTLLPTFVRAHVCRCVCARARFFPPRSSIFVCSSFFFYTLRCT